MSRTNDTLDMMTKADGAARRAQLTLVDDERYQVNRVGRGKVFARNVYIELCLTGNPG